MNVHVWTLFLVQEAKELAEIKDITRIFAVARNGSMISNNIEMTSTILGIKCGCGFPVCP